MTAAPQWKLVPVEPTEAMQIAMDRKVMDDAPYSAIYAAMLAAAPTQAAAPITTGFVQVVNPPQPAGLEWDDKPAAPLVAELPLLTDERIEQLRQETKGFAFIGYLAGQTFARAFEAEVRAAIARAGEKP